MSFTMSWDPSSAFRAAMEEQLARINKTIAAIDVNDADAEEMNRRLKTQRDDLESRLNGPGHSTTSVSTAGERKPEAVNSISPQSDGSGSPALMSKAAIRAEIGPELLKVAIPDSRFHYDLNSFIPDFKGSAAATRRFTNLSVYKNAKFIYIAPDNSLQPLRLQALHDGKEILTATRAMRRGFYLLHPLHIPEQRWEYGCSLDGLEKVGKAMPLVDLLGRKIDLVVTGAIAVDTDGTRCGTGHGYFDLQWTLLYNLELIDDDSRVVSLVHECQVSKEAMVEVERNDVACDIVVTPARMLEIDSPRRPNQRGVVEDSVEPEMEENIPVLKEMDDVIEQGLVEGLEWRNT